MGNEVSSPSFPNEDAFTRPSQPSTEPDSDGIIQTQSDYDQLILEASGNYPRAQPSSTSIEVDTLTYHLLLRCQRELEEELGPLGLQRYLILRTRIAPPSVSPPKDDPSLQAETAEIYRQTLPRLQMEIRIREEVHNLRQEFSWNTEFSGD
jgi:hypothetical protein